MGNPISLSFDKYYKFITSLGVLMIGTGMYLQFQLVTSAYYELADINSFLNREEMFYRKLDKNIKSMESLIASYVEATKSGIILDKEAINELSDEKEKLDIVYDKYTETFIEAKNSIDKSTALKNKIEVTKISSFCLVFPGMTLFITGAFQWMQKERFIRNFKRKKH